MTNDKTTEQPIPESFENWISEWLKENVVSGPDDWENHNAKVIWARAIAIDIYRHVSGQLLHSLPPSPLEAEMLDVIKEMLQAFSHIGCVGRDRKTAVTERALKIIHDQTSPATPSLVGEGFSRKEVVDIIIDALDNCGESTFAAKWFNRNYPSPTPATEVKPFDLDNTANLNATASAMFGSKEAEVEQPETGCWYCNGMHILPKNCLSCHPASAHEVKEESMTDEQVKIESLGRVVENVIAEAEEYKTILERIYRELFHLSPDTEIDFDKIRQMYMTPTEPVKDTPVEKTKQIGYRCRKSYHASLDWSFKKGDICTSDKCANLPDLWEPAYENAAPEQLTHVPDISTECNTEVEMTVGLIDSLMSIAKVLVQREWHEDPVLEALKDLREDDDLKRIMDIGDLWAARKYIEEQKAYIKVLLDGKHFIAADHIQNIDVKELACKTYLRITSYSSRKELGGIERAWIEAKIAEAISEAIGMGIGKNSAASLTKAKEDFTIWLLDREIAENEYSKSIQLFGTPAYAMYTHTSLRLKEVKEKLLQNE